MRISSSASTTGGFQFIVKRNESSTNLAIVNTSFLESFLVLSALFIVTSERSLIPSAQSGARPLNSVFVVSISDFVH